MTRSELTDDWYLKLSDLGTQLDLLLNVDDPAQKALWDVLDKIYTTTGIDERQKLDVDLIRAGRAVMKEEWEKIKGEMRGATSAVKALEIEMGEYPYKRSHLVALRRTKI